VPVGALLISVFFMKRKNFLAITPRVAVAISGVMILVWPRGTDGLCELAGLRFNGFAS
jgi:drug/metabolite transporter (DMT)-like permease